MAKKIKPRLQKTLFEARYKAELNFFNLLYHVTPKIDGYPDWATDRLSIVLRNFEHRCSLTIKHKNFIYEQDSKNTQNEEKRIHSALKVLPEGLEISSFNRLGFRRFYLIDLSMSLEEITSILYVKLLSQDKNLLKIIPPQIDDLLYRLDCSDTNFKYHITLGPADKKEVPKWININRENHLAPESAQADYLEIIDKYPDAALYFDVDVYREKDIKIDEGIAFYDRAKDRIDELLSNIIDYILTQ